MARLGSHFLRMDFNCSWVHGQIVGSVLAECDDFIFASHVRPFRNAGNGSFDPRKQKWGEGRLITGGHFGSFISRSFSTPIILVDFGVGFCPVNRRACAGFAGVCF